MLLLEPLALLLKAVAYAVGAGARTKAARLDRAVQANCQYMQARSAGQLCACERHGGRDDMTKESPPPGGATRAFERLLGPVAWMSSFAELQPIWHQVRMKFSRR